MLSYQKPLTSDLHIPTSALLYSSTPNRTVISNFDIVQSEQTLISRDANKNSVDVERKKHKFASFLALWMTTVPPYSSFSSPPNTDFLRQYRKVVTHHVYPLPSSSSATLDQSSSFSSPKHAIWSDSVAHPFNLWSQANSAVLLLGVQTFLSKSIDLPYRYRYHQRFLQRLEIRSKYAFGTLLQIQHCSLHLSPPSLATPPQAIFNIGFPDSDHYSKYR